MVHSITASQHQAEGVTGATMNILNGHYSYKSTITLPDNRRGLDTDKVNLAPFVQISAPAFGARTLQMGSSVLQMGLIILILITSILVTNNIRGLFSTRLQNVYRLLAVMTTRQ